MAIDTPSRTSALALRTAYNERCRAISADGRLLETSRLRQLANEYLQHKAQLAALGRSHQAEVAAKKSRLEHAAFVPPHDAEASRQAIAAMEDLNPAQLQTRFTRAQRVGDDVTAHAAFVLAAEKGVPAIVDAYTADRPDTAVRLAELRNLEQASADPTEALFPPFRALRPAGLSRIPDSALQALAQSPEAAPTPAT